METSWKSQPLYSVLLTDTVPFRLLGSSQIEKKKKKKKKQKKGKTRCQLKKKKNELRKIPLKSP